HARFTDAVFAACPALKMVSVWGTGTDNFDLHAAGMRGVTICNTPGVNAFAVAEHALALMLAVGRRIAVLDPEIRNNNGARGLLTAGGWRTSGTIGRGAGGARGAPTGEALGRAVPAGLPTGHPAKFGPAGTLPAAKEEILARADVISLNMRLGPETRGF